MLKARGAVGIGKLRLLGDRLYLSSVPIVARDIALIVGGINNIGIGWIRSNITRFASTHVIPVGAINRAVIAAAGDGHRAAILLCAINAVRRVVIGDHVIELRCGLVVLARPILATIECDG